MGKFVGNALIEHHRKDCERFTVKKRIAYIADDGRVFNILPNWNTDGASFPTRFLGCPFAGCYLEGALLHDMLYGAQIVSRKEADKLFLEAMKNNGVPFYTRWKMYSGVRVGGWSAWNKVTDAKREYFKQFIYTAKHE